MAVANKTANILISNLKTFKGSNLSAIVVHGQYEIYSYWTLMASVSLATKEITYRDSRQYSRTTTKHQGIISHGLNGFMESIEAVTYER